MRSRLSQGQSCHCKIKSRKEGGQTLYIVAVGATDIMLLNLQIKPEGARTEQDIADVFRHARDGGQLLPLRGLKNAILGVAEVGTKRY